MSIRLRAPLVPSALMPLLPGFDSPAQTITALCLQSGSNGNCLYIEAGGTALLVDAGLSARQIAQRLALCGKDIRSIKGVIISHDHADHVRGARMLNRRFGLPVYMTKRGYDAAHRRGFFHQGDPAQTFCSGETLAFGAIRVETIPTPHDGTDGVAFVICHEGKRLGVLTDLGHCFSELRHAMASLDGVFLESNYDDDMLDAGSYPWYLKQRIRGPGGHLSNVEAARLIAESASSRLKWACLAHLSEHNNDPQVALATHRQVLGAKLMLRVAKRYGASESIAL